MRPKPGQVWEVIHDVIDKGYGVPVFSIEENFRAASRIRDILIGERFIIDRHLIGSEVPYELRKMVQWKIQHWSGVWRISNLDLTKHCKLVG